jgi:hypothetical protein
MVNELSIFCGVSRGAYKVIRYSVVIFVVCAPANAEANAVKQRAALKIRFMAISLSLFYYPTVALGPAVG